jgi:hypothetical protein
VNREFRAQSRLLWSHKACLSQLKMSRPTLRERERQLEGERGILNFCHNIISAHRTGAFGGKPALWDFMQDVARNLNRSAKGFRFSDNSKSFARAMKMYSGRRMVDLYSLNMYGPSYDIVKRENKKGVHFVPGEYQDIFRCVVGIYRRGMVAHDVSGPIPVILSEDETKVKARATWEAKYDILAGFCGPKDDHTCDSRFKPVVGTSESGYNAIMDALTNNKLSGFARIVVVNSLHKDLHRLVLLVCATCNCFDAECVRRHWEVIAKLWKEECEQVIGLILGHASDGDSHRRQLMLQDYTSSSGNRYAILWDGWLLSGCLGEDGFARGSITRITYTMEKTC